MKLHNINTLFFLAVLVSLLGTGKLHAQQAGQLTLSGPTISNIGDNATYALQDYSNYDGSVGYDYWDMEWYIGSGTFVNSSPYGSTSVQVHWEYDGLQSVYVLYHWDYSWDQYYAELPVTILPEPSTPEVPTFESSSCNEAVLQHGTPPDGITWYWQSTSTGTSTANSNTTITLTSGTEYFLRAKSSYTGYWSTNSSSVSYDFDLTNATTWYSDTDGDGFGDPASSRLACAAPTGYVSNANDQCPGQYGTTNGCPSSGTGTGSTGSNTGTANGLTDANYIYTIQPQVAVTAISQLSQAGQKLHSISYYDGLGRPMQQQAIGFGGNGEDIITPIVYDAYGRQTKDYLPYTNATNGGQLRTGDITGNVQSYYNVAQYDNTTNPFAEKVIENSPLNRVLKQAAPGNDWAVGQGHEIKLDYQTNTADEVKRFDVSLTASYEPSITANATYALGELYKTVTTDENNNTTEEFKDKEGHVVLKRNYDSGVAHDTYYVYDVYGNLTYVLPPKAEGVTTAAVLDELCYQYQYDYRNRLVAKKLPGKQWEFMVYDKLDRVVATGPAFSPFSDVTGAGWLITKYDVFNRVVYTGWLNSVQVNSTERSTMQQDQTNATTINESKQASGTIDTIAVNYSNNVAPTSFKLLSVNYYDDYAIPNVSGLATSVDNQTVTTATKGLATGSWTRVPTTTAEVKAETTSILYDYKYRPIRSYTTNYLGGYTYTDSKLDSFSGLLQYTLQKHKRTGNDAELTVKEAFTYSPQKRVLTHTHQINGGAEQLLADNTYDELGKLTSKKVGNTSATPLQKVDYSYNIRGWMTKINEIGSLQQGTDPADLFSFKLNYNSVDGSTSAASPLYNGNIAETFWQTGADGNLVYRGYGYKYDGLNRLKDASYQKSSSELHNYDENLTYDKNGNIVTLLRYTHNSDGQIGAMKMDELTYDYKSPTSNQLMRVTESTSGNASRGFVDGNTTGDDYVYDANGNMTVDKNKKITSIVYNHLNLPTKIIFPTGNIVYFYNASGQKVQKVVTENTTVTTTDYLGGYQYQNTVMQFFPTAEGYVKNNPVSGINSYSYVFNYTDHLGNVRVSYAQNPSTNALTILDENNYYPFGLKHDGYNPIAPAPEYKYKFNGKELQDENIGGNQLNLYDYGARNYDPALGRWMNVDPLAEQMRRWSPYNYVFNNPLRFIDPDGMGPNDHIFDAHGNFLRDTKVGNAVKIQIGDKQYSPSQLDTSRGSRATMSKIGAYYAGKVGADAGTKITTGKGDDSSNKNPAYTTGTAISINVNGGFSKDLDDISNFKSVMKHENGHKEDNEKPNFKGDISTHADVYVDQMSDNSFSSTTSDFKMGSAGSFGNYLLNMDKSTEFSQNDIISKMDSFNQTNTGGLQIKRSGDNFGNFPKGSLSLELKYKGLTYPIPYEKVKN